MLLALVMIAGRGRREIRLTARVFDR